MNVLSRRDMAPGAPSATDRLVLDISRLLSRARAAVPTGIDRVELAWAEYLLDHEAGRLDFAAIHPVGVSGQLPFAAAQRFVEALQRTWEGGVPRERVAALGHRLLHGLLLPRPAARPRGSARVATYLLLSHQNLDRPRVVQDALARHRARLVAMVHDLIPLEFPEYCGPRQPARHRLRVDTVARQAAAVIVPSRAVRDGLVARLAARGVSLPVHVVPNGVHLAALAAARGLQAAGHAAAPPYFVCLGTIEPRKNHALLLAVWRQLAATLGRDAPRLVLVGRRGWECEHVHRLIDRAPALKELVTEHNSLTDTELVRLLRGARALLYPSFAEGFGLPVAEALALDVPVICSDIPPHREVGGSAAIYLHPTDGPGWAAAIDASLRRDPATTCASARVRRHVAPLTWAPTVRAALDLLDNGSALRVRIDPTTATL